MVVDVPITPPPAAVVCGGDIAVPAPKLLLTGRGGGGEFLVGLRPDIGVSWWWWCCCCWVCWFGCGNGC